MQTNCGKFYGIRTLCCAVLWNGLIIDIRTDISLDIFKAKLKGHFVTTIIRWPCKLNVVPAQFNFSDTSFSTHCIEYRIMV